MRRGGRMRGRGRNQPGRQQIRPLMSEHIQNIDLELELLKQKREMIEQHQLMLENKKMYDQQKRFNTDKPRYYEQVPYDSPGPSRSEHNFARYYDNPATEDDYIPLSSSRKRPADGGWPRGSSPKRFGSRRGSVAQSFGSRLGPKPASHNPRTAHGDYRAGSKSASRIKSGKPVHAILQPKEEVVEEDFVLRPDCDPSSKVWGRLEYAFGTILKQMREHFSDKAEFIHILNHNPFVGMLKTALRGRIKTLMMNKIVSHGDDVMTMYRKKYPLESDVAFMKRVRKDINARTANVLPLNDDVMAAPINPVNYINNEMGKVMDAELHEIIRKLEIINNPKLTEAQKEKRLAMESVEVRSIRDDERDTEEVKLWKREVHKKIRQKLPQMLIKNVPSILKFLRLDLVYINTWTALMSKTKDADEGGVHKLEVGIEGETAFAPVFRAKVRGHPKLPPKIRQFLEPFKPVWIKRNKVARNIVYVQFRDKEGLDQLVQQNGMNIGDCSLRITGTYNKKNESNTKVSKVKTKARKQTRRSVAYKASKQAENKHQTSSDLDNQIDDLLSSIRQAEEDEVDLNIAMIELQPEIKIEKDNDVNTPQDESHDVTTEESNECGEQDTEVKKNNECSDDTAQDTVQSDNTVPETKTDEQNVGEGNAVGDTSTVIEAVQAKDTDDKEAGNAEAADVEQTDKETL